MKLITFTVPCYNSESYMRKCVDSILAGGNEIEIIIVNDGSKDKTAEIADEYVAAHPDIVRAVHKENGGHGSGVNAGLRLAQGLFFKVVDSDDWLNTDALKKLLAVLKSHVSENKAADLYITNFIYDRPHDNSAFVRRFEKNFPIERFCTWEKVKKFKNSEVLLMHSLLYRTEVLRASQTILPEHTFYVDNLFAYKPLTETKTIYYLDVNLYHYFIGRADQSVNIINFVKRYQQQIRVMNIMLESYTFEQISKLQKGLKKYMLHCLGAIMINTMLFTCAEDTAERREDYRAIWEKLKQRDKKLYTKLRFHSYPAIVGWMPWKLRGKALVAGYNYLKKHIKLG